MKRKIIGFGILAIALVGIGIYFYNYLESYEETQSTQENGERAEARQKGYEKTEESEKDTPAVSTLDESQDELAELFQMDMSEGAVMSSIHEMSHQKVQANQKWGSLQITPERIE